MQLEIISPLRIITHEIAWIEFNTDAGSFVIQKGHAPTLLVLKPYDNIVYRLKTGKQETTEISSGIADIQREKVTVIVQ